MKKKTKKKETKRRRLGRSNAAPFSIGGSEREENRRFAFVFCCRCRFFFSVDGSLCDAASGGSQIVVVVVVERDRRRGARLCVAVATVETCRSFPASQSKGFSIEKPQKKTRISRVSSSLHRNWLRYRFGRVHFFLQTLTEFYWVSS